MHDLFLFTFGMEGFIIFPHSLLFLCCCIIYSYFWLVSYSSGREFGWIFIAYSSRKFIGEGFFVGVYCLILFAPY